MAGKFPLESGKAIVVAQDEEKIGEVVWAKLGRAGAFRVVRDPATGLWRARRPGDVGPGKPAPPLVPPRMIKSIVWVSKRANIPKKLVMKNGWEVNFYSGQASSDSVQGMEADIVVFDEEIKNSGWYSESIARLIDRAGWFWWGATPRVGTQQLYDLHLRGTEIAEAQQAGELPGVPDVAEVFLSIWDNPHLGEEEKRRFEASLDEDQRSLRIEGNFAITGTRVFEASFFPRGLHGVEPFPIPANWCRFASIDPGHQVGAVLFAAIPPPKYDGALDVDPGLFGDFVYFYDEIYIRGCDAAQIAKAFKEHVGDQEMYVHLIDHHGGKLTEIGTGKSPEQQYRDAFKAQKVRLPTAGTMFTYGSDDVDGRILRIKDWLRVRPDGTAKLRFIRGAVRNTIANLERYSWKVTDGQVTDKPVKKGDHQCDNAGYICLYTNLRYHKPRPREVRVESGYAAWKRLKAEEARLLRRDGQDRRGVTLA